MTNCEVWSIVDLESALKGRKLIGNRWMFKEKRDETLRARLVALGYSKVTGIDFSDHFSAVVRNTSF
jgi:Reverse transcriptase (RNA-dependent DNA polymerase)